MARKRCARLALAAALAAVVGTSFALLGCGPGEVSQPQAEEPGATQGASDETSQAISATTGGYTLAIDGFAIDENGCGFATFTLSNPDGLNGYVGETGEFVSEGTPALDAIQMRAGEDAKPNAYYAMDATSPAATEAKGRVCFDTRGEGGVPCDLAWVMISHEGEGDSLKTSETSTEGTGSSYDATPTHSFSSADGATASLSPLGIVLDTGVNTNEGQFIDKSVTLQREDGVEIVVYGSDGAISATQGMRSDGSSSYAFLENTSIDDVVSVTLEGTQFGIDSEQDVTYVLTAGE